MRPNGKPQSQPNGSSPIGPGRPNVRVCMLGYAFYESDTRIMQYATALAKRGNTVDVIALRREGQPFHEVLNGVNVFRIQLRTVNEQKHLVYLYRIIRFLCHAALVLSRKHLRRPYQLVHVHSVPDFLVFAAVVPKLLGTPIIDRKSTRLNSSHSQISYAVFCLKKKKTQTAAALLTLSRF